MLVFIYHTIKESVRCEIGCQLSDRFILVNECVKDEGLIAIREQTHQLPGAGRSEAEGDRREDRVKSERREQKFASYVPGRSSEHDQHLKGLDV